MQADAGFLAHADGRPLTAKSAILCAVAFSLVAFFLVSSFYSNVTLPLEVGIVVLLGLAVSGVVVIRVSRYSVLPRLMTLIYVLPFATLLPYVWNAQFQWAVTRRGLRFSSDKLLLAQMVAVGTAGLLGLFVGMYLAIAIKSKARSRPSPGIVERSGRHWRTLSRAGYVMLLIGAWSLSWFSAPTKSIFAAAYFSAGTQAQSELLNFNAAYLASYVILVLLFIDAERDTRDPRRQRWKYRALIITTVAIVIYLQVLRGNRESSGLIAALVALYVTGPTRTSLRPASPMRTRRRVLRIAAPVVIAGLAFIALGSARHTLSDPSARGFDLTEQLRAGWQESTWKGVLLTNLSIAAQYRHGTIDYLNGQTYGDIVLSLPPGPVMASLGLERPFERGRGPAAWTRDVSAGGAHIAIVPFKNFGMAGVFLVLCLYGYLIVRLEQLNDPRSFWGRLLYGSAVTCSFLWFWLGDITMVRALIIAGIVGVSYRAVYSAGSVAYPKGKETGMAPEPQVLTR